ncbi:MAG: hypothetical protein KBT03_11575 [Bacteroidales bacterium]|nr:hypothetical protein [Candidatus Scybalousia scybalohippi]
MQNIAQNKPASIMAETVENSSVSVFENEEFGTVRTIEKDGKIYFCGSDVAKALGYKRPNDAVNQHCKGDTVFYSIIDTLGRTQEARFITEGDVYRLIAHSKLPSAQKFESWVFDEVLPTIRETGFYSTKKLMSNEELYQLLVQSTANLNNAMAGLYSQQKFQNDKIDNVDSRLAKIEQRVEQRQALLPPPEMDIKARINKLVRDYAKLHNLEFKDVWHMLYGDFAYRTHTNPRLCAKNRGLKTIEFLEQEKQLDLLETIAAEILSA